jgi:hypothetical protein
MRTAAMGVRHAREDFENREIREFPDGLIGTLRGKTMEIRVTLKD